MSKRPLLAEIGPCLTMKGLHQALDYAYRQLLETAKADWQRLFASADRGDTTITIRHEIAEELTGSRRPDPIPAKRRQTGGKTQRRPA